MAIYTQSVWGERVGYVSNRHDAIHFESCLGCERLGRWSGGQSNQSTASRMTLTLATTHIDTLGDTRGGKGGAGGGT